MSDERRRRLIKRADDFDEREEESDIAKSIERLFAIGRWNRRLIVVLGVVLVFLGFLYLRVNSNSNAIHQVCHIEHTLWGPLLAENKAHPQKYATEEERKRAEKLTAVFQHTLDTCKE